MSFPLKRYLGDPVFVGSFLQLFLSTNQDLTDNLGVFIKARKPNGEEISKSASVSGSPTAGIITYDFTNTDIHEAGDWVFWPSVKLELDGGIATDGKGIIIPIYDPGTA